MARAASFFVKDVAEAMLKIARLMDNLSEADRRQVARSVQRTYGGKLTGAERAAAFKERWGRPPSNSVVTVPDEKLTDPSNGAVTVEASVSPTPPQIPKGFRVPESIAQALTKSRILGAVTTLRSTNYWRAEVRANPGVDFAAEVLKAEAWMVANPDRAPRKNFSRFLHTWLGRCSERL